MLKAVIREILFDKRYVPDCERPPVQILERACVRFKPKGQLIGIEKLPGFPEALILLVFAILAVSEQGAAERSHMCADLMGAAGEQAALYKGQPIAAGERAVDRLCNLCARTGRSNSSSCLRFSSRRR